MSTAVPRTLLVADDHPIVCEGIAAVLRGTHIGVVGFAARGSEAIDLAERLRPDVILLDLRLPDMLAPEVVRGVRRRAPTARTLIFTAHPDHASVAAALDAGASGCLVKDVGETDLVEAIERVATDGAIDWPGACADALTRTFRGRPMPPLSPREYEVLRRVAIGETNAEIAVALFLAANTVKTYWQSALQKLGARNRAEAITIAHGLDLL